MANYTLITNTKQYIGAAANTKATDAPVGSIAWETDTFWEYRWDGTTWHKTTRIFK